MKKKKIIFHSNYHKLFTGFGKNAKNIISYLYKTGKYEIIEVANGKPIDDPELKKLPWKAYSGMPPANKQISPEEQKRPEFQRELAYGKYGIDEIIKKEKPDIYLGAEDIWAFSGFTKKNWWNKINCMIWTTLDSLPILPEAVAHAPQIKNYYTWASFASKELNKLGHQHVKTLNGSIDCSSFYRLSNEEKSKLRNKFNINNDDFIIGFVFRNQLRKSVPNLLDGFNSFLSQNPESKAKLLLHTHWSEGWDIPRLIKEKNIDSNLILTTYFCKECKRYEIKPFSGQSQSCRFCGATGSQETTNIGNGVDEKQLNEIYNLMDVYCHPFTSGGMEIPVFEAKLTELITLVTNYSCGEDSCTEESGGLPLEWSEYREPGTQFIKATTYPSSIAKNLKKVFMMKADKKKELEKRARNFVLENYSIEVVGKELEEIFNSMPEHNWDFDFSIPLRDPSYNPPNIENNAEWLIDIYKNILKVKKISIEDKGLQGWLAQLNQGKPRHEILQFFRQTAFQENQQIHKVEFGDLLDKDDKDNRLAVVISGGEEEVYLANSLINSLKAKYSNYNIYAIIRPECFDLIESNANVHKCLAFSPAVQDPLLLEGVQENEGYFKMAFFPEVTKNQNCIFHNGLD